MNTNKGSVVKKSGNDVEGFGPQKVLFQPNVRVILQYSVNIQVTSIELVVKFCTYFSFHTIPSGVQTRKSFLVSVTVKYSYHFPREFLVELQRHVNQNKITVGFLEMTFY